jgi:hypothetical protein
MADLAQKVFLPLRVSGRLTIAQQFTAGIGCKRSESVKRTADDKGLILCSFSTVRFTDYPQVTAHPSDESLGYYQSSANADRENDFLCRVH